jgi:hypothetical protein
MTDKNAELLRVTGAALGYFPQLKTFQILHSADFSFWASQNRDFR